MRRYTSSKVSARLVEVVERGRLADHRYGGCRVVRTKRTSTASIASRVPAVTRSGPAGPSPTTTMRAAIRAQDDAGTLSVVAGVGPFGGSTVPVERFHRAVLRVDRHLGLREELLHRVLLVLLRDLLLQEAGHLLERAGPPLLDLDDELAPLGWRTDRGPRPPRPG